VDTFVLMVIQSMLSLFGANACAGQLTTHQIDCQVDATADLRMLALSRSEWQRARTSPGPPRQCWLTACQPGAVLAPTSLLTHLSAARSRATAAAG
jgi:hypothetical protein